MKNINLFSEKLKLLREQAKLSQVELGNAIGLSKQTINDMEHGRSKTTLDRAILISDFFNISLDFLVGRSNFSHMVMEDDEGNIVITDSTTPSTTK